MLNRNFLYIYPSGKLGRLKRHGVTCNLAFLIIVQILVSSLIQRGYRPKCVYKLYKLR